MMQDFILLHYDWFKAFHIISVISWLAGLLYLPRLFVYHAGAASGSELSETLKVMEKKLYRYIMNPAMIATWFFGLSLVLANPAYMQQGWLHAKLGLVILLTGFHHVLGRWRKNFLIDKNTKTAGFFRKVNEVPTVIMIAIVILVVVKPF